MPTVLLVANQTLAGGEVESFVRSRLDSEPSAEFKLLVPATAHTHVPADRTTRVFGAAFNAEPTRVFGASTNGPRTTDSSRQDTTDADFERARARLEFGLSALRRLGATVDGGVGDSNPFTAISEALERRRFDEVVLFTLPQGVSRWLHLDIPHRVERKCHVAVTVITAGQ